MSHKTHTEFFLHSEILQLTDFDDDNNEEVLFEIDNKDEVVLDEVLAQRK